MSIEDKLIDLGISNDQFLENLQIRKDFDKGNTCLVIYDLMHFLSKYFEYDYIVKVKFTKGVPHWNEAVIHREMKKIQSGFEEDNVEENTQIIFFLNEKKDQKPIIGNQQEPIKEEVKEENKEEVKSDKDKKQNQKEVPKEPKREEKKEEKPKEEVKRRQESPSEKSDRSDREEKEKEKEKGKKQSEKRSSVIDNGFKQSLIQQFKSISFYSGLLNYIQEACRIPLFIAL